jgi:hypothetical protein
MRRLRALFPVALVIIALIVSQAIMVFGTSTYDEPGSSALGRGVRSIVRDDGPIMERIPAPVVVVALLAVALVATGAWYALVRWTDVSEEF